MPTFNLLHISDLHFRANRGLVMSRHDPTLAETVARIATNGVKRGELDRVLVTGDVATTGSIPDQGAAEEFFRMRGDAPGWVTSRGKPTLSTIEEVVDVIPGNHDRYSGPMALPGAEVFDALFDGLWRPLGASWPDTRVALFPPLEKSDHFLQFVGCDLSLRSVADARAPGTWLGWGRADRSILDRAVEVSRTLQSKKSLICWLVHFPPNAEWKLQLLDHPNLIDALEQAGVSIVFFGHTHRAAYVQSATRVALTAGTATELNSSGTQSANFYRVVFDASQPRVSVEARLLSLARNPVVAAQLCPPLQLKRV